MPDIALLIPQYPTHWTSIVHYLIILGTLVMLMTTGDQDTTLYLLVLAILGTVTAADLYAGMLGFNRKEIGRLIIFAFRILMFAIPALLAGLTKEEQTRGVSIMMSIFLGLPMVAITLVNCVMPAIIADPRIIQWCR